MNRRSFIGTVAGAAAAAQAPAKKPNIVVIMADDMGFSDIGCYGSEIETPHIDSIARKGVRFTHMYNTARCCPTRASLLTGLYSHQAGMGRMVEDLGKPGYRGFLNEQCVTLGEALRPAGYRTLMTGKWHVGERRPHWPVDRGFDRYYGLISGASNYFSSEPGRQMALDSEPAKAGGDDFYITDAFTDHAVRFMDDRKPGQPFLLYLAYTAPHWPLHALERDIRKYRDRYRMGWDQLRRERHARMLRLGLVDEKWPLSPRDPQGKAWDTVDDKEWQARRMAVYAAQIDRMDQNIGRVLAKLKAMGEEENTLILFLADNGGCAEPIAPGFRGLQGKVHTDDGKVVQYGNVPGVWPGAGDTFASYGLEWANASNTPFRQYKSTVHEGGIATPLVAQWPAGISARNKIVNQTGHVIDIMPTCLDAAAQAYPRTHKGQEIVPVSGESLRPAFSGQPFARKSPLFWEHIGNRAVRDGDWKLVARSQRPWELYNMRADRTELRDLALSQPGEVARLTATYDAWAKRCNVLPVDQLRKG